MAQGHGGLEEIRTKVSGGTMGPEAELRQEGMRRLKALTPEQRAGRVELIPDWGNPYDSDALEVVAILPTGGAEPERIQIGFVKNSDTICDLCGWTYARFPSRCKRCGHSDHLRRDGAATRISKAMRAEPNRHWWAEVLDVTGGEEEKPSFGVNLLIRSVVRSATRAGNQVVGRGLPVVVVEQPVVVRELGNVWGEDGR